MNYPLSLLALPAEMRLLIYSYLLPDLLREKRLTVRGTIERRLDSKDRNTDWTEDSGRDADYLKTNGVDEHSDWIVAHRLQLENHYSCFSEASDFGALASVSSRVRQELLSVAPRFMLIIKMPCIFPLGLPHERNRRYRSCNTIVPRTTQTSNTKLLGSLLVPWKLCTGIEVHTSGGSLGTHPSYFVLSSKRLLLHLETWIPRRLLNDFWVRSEGPEERSRPIWTDPTGSRYSPLLSMMATPFAMQDACHWPPLKSGHSYDVKYNVMETASRTELSAHIFERAPEAWKNRLSRPSGVR